MTSPPTAILLLGIAVVVITGGVVLVALLPGTIGTGFDRGRARGRVHTPAPQTSQVGKRSAGDHSAKTSATNADVMRTIQFVTVGLHRPASEPVMLLQECEPPGRVLPIHVAHSDAARLDDAQRYPKSQRSDAHSLITELIQQFNCRLLRVELVGLHEGVFYAQVVLDNGTIISARPSDAVSLALQTEAPIRSTRALLRSAGKDPDLLVFESEAEQLVTKCSTGEVDATSTDMSPAVDPVGPEDSEPALYGAAYSATENEIGPN